MVVRLHAPPAKKLVALDGVRGLAILAVMLHHSAGRLNPVTLPQHLLAWLLYQGWTGVDLFFVLSGFLITGILLDSRSAENYFLSFYARRALRIFPLYLAFISLALTLFPLVTQNDWMPLPSDRWLYWCYLTNWLVLWRGPWRHSVMAHLWSLAVEEQFYCCWPVLVWLLRPSSLLVSILSTEVAVIAGRFWWVIHYGSSQTVALATLTRVDGLLLGAACAIVVRRYRLSSAVARRLLPLALGGMTVYLVLVIGSLNPERYVETFGFPLIAACGALVVLYSVLTEGCDGPVRKFLCWGKLTDVGRYAYGMYIFHVPLFYFADRIVNIYAPPNVRSSFWFGCCISASLCAISYQFAKLSYVNFERYFLMWKDRFQPSYAGH
jgi:peptidoglycan/LPS O-acetylase OafA/YrhL